MTKPKSDEQSLTANWEKDWHIEDGDEELSRKLTSLFEAYLTALQKKGVSKSTLNRHANSCHALGGYIVEQLFGYQCNRYDSAESGKELLLRYLDGKDGPLVFPSEESWQRQLDTTCRKLYKFLVQQIV